MSPEVHKSMITWFLACNHSYYELRKNAMAAVEKLKKINQEEDLLESREINIQTRDITAFTEDDDVGCMKLDAMLTIPMAFIAGLTLELGLKALWYKVHGTKYRNPNNTGHEINLIFDGLSADQKNKLIEKTCRVLECDHGEFDRLLASNVGHFVIWRYGYEDRNSRAEINFDTKFVEALLAAIKTELLS